MERTRRPTGSENGSPQNVIGCALLSPAGRLESAARWFVDGSAQHHIARAARAVAAGRPEELLVLSSRAPVPMVAEAATILSVWGPDTLAVSQRHVPALDVPLLVTVGSREPPPYRENAAAVVAAARTARLEVLDDDHYYGRDRAALVRLLLGWFDTLRDDLTAPSAASARHHGR